MDEVNKALDSVSSKPLEELRDKSEAALDRFNADIASTVTGLEKLKIGLANTGGINQRELKKTEDAFARLKRLGLDDERAGKIGSTLDQIKIGAGLRDPAAEAAIAQREKVAAAEKTQRERSAALDKALHERAARVVETLKSREVAAERKSADTIDGIHSELFDRDETRQKTASTRERQRSSTTGGGAAASVGDASLKSVVGKFDKLTGGRKFDLGKGLEFGIGGVAAAFVADTLAGATSGALEARDKGENAFAGFAKSLPIVGGIATAVGNIYELWTGVARRNAEVIALQHQQRDINDQINTSLAQRQRILDTANNRVTDQRAAAAISEHGGKQGRLDAVEAEGEQRLRDLARENSDNATGIRAQRTKALSPLFTQEIGLQTKVGGAVDAERKAELQSQLATVRAQQKQIRDEAAKALADNDKAFDVQVSQNNADLGTKRAVASGSSSDFRAIDDQLESIAKSTRTIDGDPFVQLRKSFAELDTQGVKLQDFDAVLDEHRKRLKEVEKESRAFNANKGIDQILELKSTAGLRGIDAEIAKYTNEGASGDRLTKIRIRLETDEAIEAAKQFKDTLEDLKNSTKITLAVDPKERAQLEVAAENAKRLQSGQKTLTPEEAAKLVAGKLDLTYAGKAAATIEAGRTPQEKFARSVDDLKEQFARGFLTDEQLKRGLGGALSEEANGLRTSRPELLEAGTAAATQFLAVNSGAVIDASNPEIQLAKEANGLLQKIVDQTAARRPSSISTR